jgi:hypothetical protein
LAIKPLSISPAFTLLSRLFYCEGSVKKMKTVTRSRKQCGALQFATLLLLACSLAGCELPVSAPPKTVALPPEPVTPIQEPVAPKPAPKPYTPIAEPVSPPVVQSSPAQTVRIVIYFQHSTTDSSQLAAAVAEACRCKPVFFRQYRVNALIYVIGLAQDISYAAFENALLQNAAKLGIRSVEQDVVEHF